MKTKKMFFLLVFLFIGIHCVVAQAPQKFNYQAVVRDAGGLILSDQSIALKIAIRQGTFSGSILYDEIHDLSTNQFGLASLQIGGGIVISGDMNSIDWSDGPYYVEVYIDPNGGNNFVSMGVSQLLSVPYALYAESSGTEGAPGPIGETGPAGPVGPIGETGPAGPTGATGLTGSDGEIGPAGPQGETGPMGEQGIQGPIGLQGPVGETGQQGIPGPIGPTGPQGLIGLTGPQGPAGIFASNKIDVLEADVVANQVGEITLWSFDVPGGTLLIDNAVRMRMLLSVQQNNSNVQLSTLRIKYGGVTLVSFSFDWYNSTGLGEARSGIIEVVVMGNGSSDSQRGYMSGILSVVNPNYPPQTNVIYAVPVESVGTVSVDSELSQTMSVTYEWQISNGCNTILRMGVAEKIQ